MNEITGTIVQIADQQSGVSRSGNPWTRQTIVVQTDGQYPQHIAFDVVNGKCDTSELSIGLFVKAFINISSREYLGRWYTTLTATSITELTDVGAYSPQPAPSAIPTPPQGCKDLPEELPF